MQSVMESTRENQFREQAKSELQNRIEQINRICDQFKKSYSGYSSVVRQVIFVIFLGFVIAACAFTAANIKVLLSFLKTQSPDRDLLLIKSALIGVSLYIVLHIVKIIMRIGKISRIDSFVSKVHAIEKDLRCVLDNLENIAGNAVGIISGSKNEKLAPPSSVDSDIKKYSDLAGTYTKDNYGLNTALTIVHWLSGILFVGVFLVISVPFVTERFGSRFVFGWYNPVVFLYTAFVLSLYMLMQELSAKGSVEQLHIKCRSIISIIFIAGFLGLVLYHLVWQEDSLFRNSFALVSLTSSSLKITLACIPLATGAVFSSLICHMNKRGGKVINFIYAGCITAVLLLFLRDLFSFSIENYGNFWQTFLALFLPLATAGLFSTGFIVMGGGKRKVFVSLLIGGGLYVIAVICILAMKDVTGYMVFYHFLSVFENINMVTRIILIGAIVVFIIIIHDAATAVVGIILIILFLNLEIMLIVITAILVFALTVFIVLLPGLLLCLAASHIRKQRSKNIIFIMTAVISAVILVSAHAKSDISPSVPQNESYTYLYVTSDGLNVRASPSADSDTVTPLPLFYGTMIELIKGFQEDGWIKIRYNDVEGWVNSAYTAQEPPPKR